MLAPHAHDPNRAEALAAMRRRPQDWGHPRGATAAAQGTQPPTQVPPAGGAADHPRHGGPRHHPGRRGRP